MMRGFHDSFSTRATALSVEAMAKARQDGDSPAYFAARRASTSPELAEARRARHFAGLLTSACASNEFLASDGRC